MMKFLTVLLVSFFFQFNILYANSTLRLDFFVSKKDLKKYKKKEKKYVFSSARASLNLGAETEVKLKTRGSSCLGAERRCFSIKFPTSVNLDLDGKTVLKGKSFKLISMWEDEGYIHNKIGLSFLNVTGVTQIENVYLEVFINGSSNGLYMITRSPKSIMKKKFKTPFIARRVEKDIFYLKVFRPEESPFEEDTFFLELEKIKNIFSQGHESSLKDDLSEKMDLQNYLKWLALNHFLKNGDYTDEVFFYSDRSFLSQNKIYFKIFAWDYDDIFKEPHQSLINERYANVIQKSLLYSFESSFDRRIYQSPSLYSAYKSIYKDLLVNILKDEVLEKVFSKVKYEIMPYLARPHLLEFGKKPVI